MKYRSVFDIIGPVMIGPSSSHTAGAARMGQVACQLFRHEPERVSISLYGSFAKTYRGHGTDVALIGGILGFETDDLRIPEALEIAKERNIEVEFIEEDAMHLTQIQREFVCIKVKKKLKLLLAQLVAVKLKL